MTSIPPLSPVTGVENSRGDMGPRQPETMRYLVGAWSVMLLGEFAHQLLNAIGLVLDPATLKQAAADAAKARGEEVSDALITVSTYVSITMMSLFQLLIIVLLVVALRAVAGRKKWSDTARRLLTVFSIFFIIRTALVMLAPTAVSGATQLPLAFAAALGITQIIVGVAGACGLFYASRKEVREALSDGGTTKKDG